MPYLQPLSTAENSWEIVLTCSALHLKVEFSLHPGMFARIGGTADAEVSLPFPGLEGKDILLERTSDGMVIARSDHETRVMRFPDRFILGDYEFCILTAVPREPEPGKGGPVPTQRGMAWLIGAGAAVFCIALAGTVWQVYRGQPASAAAERSANTAEVPGTPAVVPPPDPAETAQAADEKLAEPLPAAETPEKIQQPDWQKVVQSVRSSVLMIEGMDWEGNVIKTGTGFVFSDNGLVATNFHVLEGAARYEGITEQGARFSFRCVRNASKEHDLAILELEGTGVPGLSLADRSSVPVGTPVAVYGCPQGLQGTLSEGIVSAQRVMHPHRAESKLRMIQITAALSPGSSGSPVITADGRVIGVATLVLSEGQSLNFAMPVETLAQLDSSPRDLASLGELETIPPDMKSGQESPQAAQPPVPAIDTYLAAAKRKDWPEAMKLARDLTKQYPEAWGAYICLGEASGQLALHSLSLQAFERSLGCPAEDDSHSISWASIGRCRLLLKDEKGAWQAWERAVELDPANSFAWRLMAYNHAVNKRWSEMKPAMDALRVCDPDVYEEVVATCAPALPGALLEEFRRNAPLTEEAQTKEVHASAVISAFLDDSGGDDIDAEMVHYAPTVAPYFDAAKRTKQQVREELAVYRKQWPRRRYELLHVESTTFNGVTMEVIFSLRYVSKGTQQSDGRLRAKLLATGTPVKNSKGIVIGSSRWHIGGIGAVD